MTTATRRHPQPAEASVDASTIPMPPEEWTLLATWHPNVLIAGPDARTAAIVRALSNGFRAPIVAWHGGAPLPEAAGTLLLDDVAALSGADQQRLHEWLLRRGRGVQVVSTTREPLLPLVDSGRFDAMLYYELNVIYLDVPAPTPR